jgi:hypothetical protein
VPTTSTSNQRSTRSPASAAARTSATTSGSRTNSAVTAVRPGDTNSMSAALSHTTYPRPRLRIIMIIQNGSVIAKSEPPNWVPT